MRSQCLLIFTSHTKSDLYIFKVEKLHLCSFCESHDGQCYDFHLDKILSLQFIWQISWQCPTSPAHAPSRHNTCILKPNQLSPNCFLQFGNKFAKNVIRLASQDRSVLLATFWVIAPSLESLLELISMNQIRKSEVWRIRGNKWWTWKDPYLMFEYKSNFNWCSIKNLWQNVDVDYLNIFILPRLTKIFDNLR